MFRWHVVSAVFLRNLKQYFTSPLGYLFIIVFVTLCSVLTFSPQFFADNLANLDQLSRYYPLLLLFIIPAITMSIWAEEKRSGTDAILFTLPASDFEIVLGKYLSVVAVYTIALLFSTAQLWFLNQMGAPDWGMIATTYFGYWLAGCALLSVGMFASSLTRSATIAFVLGAVFCAVPVLMGEYFRGSSLLESVESVASNLDAGSLNEVIAEAPASDETGDTASDDSGGLTANESLNWLNVPLEKLGISWNLQDFAVGLIPMTNVVYFLSITAFMFYLNMVVISSRHWSGDRNLGMKGHFLVRTLALVVAFVAVNYLVTAASTYVPSRFDFTNEKLYSLSPTTIDTMVEARKQDRQVTIQAFVSSEVPREYADVKKQFVSTLRQFDLLGGNLVDLRLVNVEPFSEHEAEAKQLGILPRTVESETGSKTVEQDVFMGALISSPIDDAVLPFIDSDTSVEYELSRAIAATTTDDFSISVGIIESDVHFSGPEIDGTRITQWPVYQTANQLLNRQYEVTTYKMSQLIDFLPAEDPPATDAESAAGVEDTEDGDADESGQPELEAPDVMLVPFPSCFDTSSMEALVKYIEAGNPVLILDDPLTYFWAYQDPTGLAVFHAPNMPRVAPDNPYHDYIAASFFPKDDQGRAGKLLNTLGIDWENGTAVWSVDNPHPNFGGAFPPYRQEQQRRFLGPYDKSFVWTREVDESPIEIKEILRTVRERQLAQMPEDERERFEKDYLDGLDEDESRAGELVETHTVFNPDNPIAAGLNEVLFIYPGSISARADSSVNFEPLITLGPASGTTPWSQLTMTPVEERFNPRTGEIVATAASSQLTGEDLVVINPSPVTSLDNDVHTIAAHLTGGPDNINVVYICDLDFVSEIPVLQAEALESPLDNFVLLQNAIDFLAGKEDFVALRNRRPTPRTLTQIERGNRLLEANVSAYEQIAERRMEFELDKFKESLQQATEELNEDASLSQTQRMNQFVQQVSDEARRLQVQEVKLNEKLEEELNELETQVRRKISVKESWHRWLAVLFAPIPALFLGSVVLGYRWMREQSAVSKDRRV